MAQTTLSDSGGGNLLQRVVPWLVIAVLWLLPVGTLAEIPLGLTGLAGMAVVWRNWQSPAWRQTVTPFVVFYLCFFLAILISLPGSYHVGKTTSLALEYCRFLFFGIAVLHYCRRPAILARIALAGFAAVTLWVAYGMIHMIWGNTLAENELLPPSLRALFAERFGVNIVLGASVPFLLVIYDRHGWRAASAAATLACGLVLLWGGSRGALIMYGVAVVVFLAWQNRGSWRRLFVALALFSCCLLLGGALLNVTSDKFASRLEQTMLVFKGDYQSIDDALSWRLPIWQTAVNMIADHPATGVGARAFRYAYPHYAAADDRWVQPGAAPDELATGAYHSHQMQLEVLSETGLAGGVLFLAAMFFLIHFWRQRSSRQKRIALPYAMSICVIFFPLNTHPALYSSAWSWVIYWYVALLFAAGSIADDSVQIR